MGMSSGKFADFFSEMSEYHSIFLSGREKDVPMPIIFGTDIKNFHC
jgi:hypothetical protein